jgi:hypothetical protein
LCSQATTMVPDRLAHGFKGKGWRPPGW